MRFSSGFGGMMALVAVDGSWAICMPMKTGSHSLVSMLAPSEMSREAYNFAKIEVGWHEPVWDGNGKRILVVRHPVARFVSMLWYAKEQRNPWPVFGPWSVDDWAAKWIEGRRERLPDLTEWWTTQTEYAATFKPDVVCRLEDGLQNVFRAIGMPCGEIWHRNKTEFKLSDDETLGQINDERRALILGELESDLKIWY